MAMQPTTSALHQSLSHSNEAFIMLGEMIRANPKMVYFETDLAEATRQYIEYSAIIVTMINAGQFEKLYSYNKRTTLQGQVNNINTSLKKLQRSNFQITQEAQNWASTIASNIIAFNDLIREGLNTFRPITEDEFNDLIKGHLTSKGEYEKLKIDLKEATHINEVLKAALKDSEDKLKNIVLINSDIISNSEVAKRMIGQIEEFNTKATTLDKDNETKSLKISTFHHNVEEYEIRTATLIQQLEDVLKKESAVNALIAEAETALGLRSAQGISAAFSAQHEAYSKHKKPGWWLFGAFLCLAASLSLTVWLVSGQGIQNPNSWSSIVGRIVGVGISIAGASFCAAQYIKQRNIIEDYAYKTVLAKSIIAFKEEIHKGGGPERVAEYLNQVLKEILKDPLRPRANEKNASRFENVQKTLEQILEKLPNK